VEADVELGVSVELLAVVLEDELASVLEPDVSSVLSVLEGVLEESEPEEESSSTKTETS
jgi:hypothetical protein